MLRPLAQLQDAQLQNALPGLALAAGLAFGLSACGPEPGAGQIPTGQAPETQPQAGPQPGAPRTVDVHGRVPVALLVPLTGEAAEVGNAIANAARMAMTDLADPALDLRVHDTQGTPAGARAAAEAAAGEGAALLLGPLFGANSGAVGDVALRAGVNVVSFSNDSSVAGGAVYVSGFTPETEAERIVGYAAAQGRDRLAVFYPETAYGQAALRGAERAAGGIGSRVVVTSGYAPSFEGIQASAGAFSGAALAAGANAVLIPDSGQSLRAAAAFLDYGGLAPGEVQYLGLGQWQGAGTRQEATLRGGWFPAPDPDRFATFADLYAARHGARPPLVAVLGYDAVQMVGQLLAEARAGGGRTPFARPALTRAQGFQGALGPFAFRPDGTSRRALAVLEVSESGFEVIDPAPARLDLLF